MAPFTITRFVEHPYSQTSKAHSHFAQTAVDLPPFTAGALPFRWMLRDEARDIAQSLDLPFQDDAEALAREAMNFDSSWVQDVDN